MKKLLTILVISVVIMNFSAAFAFAAVLTFDNEPNFLSAAVNPVTYDFETSSGFPAAWGYIGNFEGIYFDAQTYDGMYVTSGVQGMAGATGTPTFSVATLDFNGLSTQPNGFGFYGLDLTDIGPEVIRVNVDYTTGPNVSYDVQLPPNTPSLTPVYFGLINTDDTIESIELFGTEVGYDYPFRAWYIDDLTIAGVYDCYPDLPDPVLAPEGTEDANLNTRYLLDVENWDAFPDELFVPAPDLPACGLNTNASRTWVDIYAEDGTRLYGFCGLSGASDLNNIWFSRPKGEVPPCVYITLTDRRCGITYTSNLVCFDVPVDVDIKPGSCPNPFNAKSKGSVPVAIIGTPSLDVTQIDPCTITLTTPSGAVISALDNYVIKDSTQPDAGDPNDCFDCFDADNPDNFNCDLWDALTDPNNPPVPGTDGILDSYCGDGYPDLVVKFDTQELADAIGRVPRNTCIELLLDGMFYSGQKIYGSDSVLTRKK